MSRLNGQTKVSINLDRLEGVLMVEINHQWPV